MKETFEDIVVEAYRKQKAKKLDYTRNEGPFTPFRVKGVAYEFRKRFAKNVERGNILDVRHNGVHVGATSIDLPYCLRKEARELVGRMQGCDCKECKARRRKGLKP